MSTYNLFTSESVSEGHPDKMADQISDAVLDAHLKQDPNARVAFATLIKTGLVVLAGEITSSAKNVDYQCNSPGQTQNTMPNTRAITLYLKQGFVKEKENNGMLIMRKSL